MESVKVTQNLVKVLAVELKEELREDVREIHDIVLSEFTQLGGFQVYSIREDLLNHVDIFIRDCIKEFKKEPKTLQCINEETITTLKEKSKQAFSQTERAITKLVDIRDWVAEFTLRERQGPEPQVIAREEQQEERRKRQEAIKEEFEEVIRRYRTALKKLSKLDVTILNCYKAGLIALKNKLRHNAWILGEVYIDLSRGLNCIEASIDEALMRFSKKAKNELKKL